MTTLSTVEAPKLIPAAPPKPPMTFQRWMDLLGIPVAVAVFLSLFLMPTPSGLSANGQSSLAIFMMALVLWSMSNYAVLHLLAGSQLQKTSGLLALVVGGGVSYFICLYGFGIFSLLSIKSLFPKRIKREAIAVIEKES